MRACGLLALTLVALVSACEKGEPPPIAEPQPPDEQRTFLCPVTQAAPDETVVLVRDRGFDLDNEVFQGRIGGCYRVVCSTQPQASASTFEEARALAITQAQRKDDSCRLEPGVSFRSSGRLASFEPQREAWNQAIRSDLTPDSPSSLGKLLDGDETRVYHGTGVAGLLAQESAKVRLVLVSDEAISFSAEASCPSESSIQRQIDLYEDPEVRAAMVSSPTSALLDTMLQVIRTHGVTVSNESFGSLPRAAIEEGCPGPWERLFSLITEVYKERTAYLEQQSVFGGLSILTLRAAGNEGLDVGSPTDFLECGGGSLPDGWGSGSETLVVGALDPVSWGIAGFSNRGACVDVYAPGARVVTWGPRGFLNVQSGTSFAAPLTGRVAAQTPGDAVARRAALEAQRDEDLRLPRELFSGDLLFQEAAAAPRRLPPAPSLARLRRWALR
jgi:hypothetical protein